MKNKAFFGLDFPETLKILLNVFAGLSHTGILLQAGRRLNAVSGLSFVLPLRAVSFVWWAE